MESLLQTKLHIPQPNTRIVIRAQLLAGMDEALARGAKLTLVSAPVGYGKSTLVSSWLSTTDCPAAWLSLDAEDNEPVRFWTYVISAIQTIQSEFGQAEINLLRKAQTPSIESVLRNLINQFTKVSKKIILVLDDYHLIKSRDLHSGVNYFLDHLPPQIHLVLITREDPPLPLPQMRAKGQMVELRARDLHFTMEECAQFLNQMMGLNLKPEEITALELRTEGWVVGLQMAALSLRELDDSVGFIEAFAGDNRYVADYLISEVLERQPKQIRDFLLKTASVDRFTPSLCNALMDDEAFQSGRIIEQIEANGLFIMPLDHVRQWYRYHQLFADLLRYRLRQDDPSKLAELNRTASHWFHQHGLIEEAVKYALIGEDHDHVAELIETTGLAMIGRSQLVPLKNWIEALPENIVHTHPYLSVLLVWVGSLTGQSDLARQQLKLAEENLSSAHPRLHSELVCQIALLHGYALRSGGDLDSSIEYILKAQGNIPKNNVFLNCTIQLNLGGNYWLKGNFSALEDPFKRAISFIDNPEVEYPALAAAGFLANAYLQQGKFRQVESLCGKIAYHAGHNAHPSAAYVFLELGELFYERNNLNEALTYLSKTIQNGEEADKIVNVIRARQLLAKAYCAMGDQEEADILMRQADDLFQQSSPRYRVMHQIEYEYYRIRCLLYQDKIQPALQWADDYKNRRNSINSPWALLSELVYARVLLANGKPDQALPILHTTEVSAKARGAGGWIIQSLALQGLCYQALNDPDKALEALSNAFSLAQPEGYIRTFVDHGKSMFTLLNLALVRGVVTDYVRKLLEAFPPEQDEEEKIEPQRVLAGQSLIEPLTEQELSILRLMSAGLSHNEIANELYLSINTVKWHTTHMYGKLGVHRRAHAVARAKELNIL